MTKAIAAGYIFFMVGMACAMVGELPKNTGPVEWWLPLLMFLIMALPWWLGYSAGKEDASK